MLFHCLILVLAVLRFQAAIHGAEMKETGQSSTKDNLKKAVPMFGDPKEYESLSQEEREEMTKKMMGKHKVWAGTAFEGK